MRDLAVTALFFFLVIYTLRRPFIGVAAWAWITFAYPAGWAWGFSTNFRMNFTVALLTFVGYVFLKEKPKIKIDGTTILIFFLWCVSLLACLFSNSLIIDYSWIKFEEFTKVLMLYVAILLIIHKKIHIDTFIWAVVLSISSYGAMEAVKYMLSLGSHRIAGLDGYLLTDRNDLAVAINMCIPMLIYLLSVTQHKTIRLGLVFLTILNIIAIVGTYSRGGFVGLVILGIYFLIKSNRKILWSIITCIGLAIASNFVPSEWSERMDTVSTASQDDGSFIGRLWAWKISVKIANENVFGNGFMATQDPLAWQTHRYSIDNFLYVPTPPVPEDLRPKAAHSIYFQVLGDFGYSGLFLYLLIMLTLFLRLNKLSRIARKHGIEWIEKLSTMMMVSLVGYGITGANVSMAYFDLYFSMIGIAFVLKNRLLPAAIAKKEAQARSST